jgi:Domain of unknown function (DUF4112)
MQSVPLSTRLATFFSRWLDKRYLDPLLGVLLPEVGDLASTLVGLSVVAVAWREGVAVPVLARMTLNLAVDGIIGAVPVLGDLFDVFFKAHSRNAALLQQRGAQRTTARDYALLALSVLGVLVALTLPLAAIVYVVIRYAR